MVVRSLAAPPTPWSKSLAEPQIDSSAYVHSFSNLIGDVHIGANVTIAPGTSIRADEGSPFNIGENSNIQDGVVIHGLEQGQVVGDDGQEYSVWIGKNASITHMALIHGPAYVGDNCFIGFRSTVFNARVGEGCIVMMHALIQDVEIPPGKYVPSGSIITNQQQADRLPDVQEQDMKFSRHVVGINEALRTEYLCASDTSCIAPIRDELVNSKGESPMTGQVYGTSLSPDVIEQVRSLLNQGCRIGIEYADERRFRTSSWSSGGALETTQAQQAIASLENILAEHPRAYVRLIGIDPKVKRRVVEQIIQRPDGKPVAPASKTAASAYPSSNGNRQSAVHASSGSLSSETIAQIKSLLSQGYHIGTEHVDTRRFRTNSWKSCTPLDSKNISEVVGALEACMNEHSGEYVRMFGIDPKARRRVVEQIIQRPDGKALGNNGKQTSYTASAAPEAATASRSHATSSMLSSETVEQVRSLLAQGYRIGSEHVDARRFRTNSWKSCSPIESNQVSQVINALEACMNEHSGEYVRVFGIDPKAKRRVQETVIQQPNANK